MKKITDILKIFGKNDNVENMNEPGQKGGNEPEKKEDNESGKKEENESGKKEDKEPGKKEENEPGKKEEKGDKKKASDGKVHIYNLIIVDESGSMGHLREATLSGINETIGTIRSAQEEYADTQEHMLTLVLFDSGSNRPDVRTIIDCKPIKEIGEFKDYMPKGWTPLYDAMGKSLTTLRKRIKDDEDASAVVTVLTDGLENTSREWNASSLRALIEQLKEEGWSFSYMGSAHDVKEVTDLLSIDNVVEFSHDLMGAENTWGRERSSRKAYYRKMNLMFHPAMSKEEKIRRKKQFASEYYGARITPDHISQLGKNEVFVFGSNEKGAHAGGAAAFAMLHFGAVWGQGEGLQGNSYAIPTMEGIDNLKAAVERFTEFAEEHQEMRFLVTKIGCGIAGYSISEIAPLFAGCIDLENVALPIEFWKILGLSMYL